MSLRNFLSPKGRKVLVRCVVSLIVVVLFVFGISLSQVQEERVEREVREVLDVYLEGDSVINVIPRGEAGDGDGGDTGDGDV